MQEKGRPFITNGGGILRNVSTYTSLEFNYLLHRWRGTFVYLQCQYSHGVETADATLVILQVGDDKRAIKGLDEGIRGMKAGGTRRIVVPPQVGSLGSMHSFESKLPIRTQG